MWIKSRIQKSWGQTNNNCRCIFQIQHIVTQTRQNLCIHKTPCYDFLKRITSVLREKLCLTIARDFTLPFEDVINCILWDIRVSAPGWASYDSIIKDSDTVFSSPVFSGSYNLYHLHGFTFRTTQNFSSFAYSLCVNRDRLRFGFFYSLYDVLFCLKRKNTTGQYIAV